MSGNNRKVTGRFLDGQLTDEEYVQIMDDVSQKKDFLTPEQLKELAGKAQDYVNARKNNRTEPYPMTKRQYVQCMEARLHEATGVTRDY